MGTSLSGEVWWSQAGSNRRPLACHASALPAELWPHERLAKLRKRPDSVKIWRSGTTLAGARRGEPQSLDDALELRLLQVGAEWQADDALGQRFADGEADSRG